jgi:hypothetical protein
MGPAFGSGGSFLGTAASTAAGVIGGGLLLNSIRSMFGDHAGLGGHERTALGSSSGSAADLAQQDRDQDQDQDQDEKRRRPRTRIKIKTMTAAILAGTIPTTLKFSCADKIFGSDTIRLSRTDHRSTRITARSSAQAKSARRWPSYARPRIGAAQG